MNLLSITVRGTVIPDRTKIAAVDLKTGSKFSTNVKPSVPNSPEAQKVSGISVDANGNMSVNGGNVASVNYDIYLLLCKIGNTLTFYGEPRLYAFGLWMTIRLCY
ncbi:hypothetical protein DPMN_054114 [Dreissena polymorpha]|uniref:Uncharacterized protein n=1 Tax=Dreissena polymorpha TaxID=45954 RepID=A0A9D4CPB8_DREPO|nr:hypothetical protein DPMN_054114 [Dreissena polymorpha]